MRQRKNRSKFASKKFDHLYKYPDRPGWYYRRYSSRKRKTFVFSTGETIEAAAYQVGLDAYNEWMGSLLPESRILIRDLARAVLATKESKKGGKAGATYRSAYNQITKHIIPAFGHLLPDQFTALRWDLYDSEERKRVYYRKGKAGELVPYKRTALMNTRKYMIEILRRAYDEDLIRKVPKLKNADQKAAAPRHIPKPVILKLIRAAGRARAAGHRGHRTKLLIYLLWKTGARPGEVIQYRWDMFRDAGQGRLTLEVPAALSKTNRARAIPLNRRAARLILWLKPRAPSPYLFPSPSDPARPVRDYKHGWAGACARVGVKYQIYNLRDTFITEALRRKESLTDIARYVDNSAAMIDQKYAVALEEALRGVAG